MWLTRVSIAQPVFAAMVMVALCVLGLFAYQKLGVEQLPDVSAPGAFIDIRYPGAAPEAVEREVTKRVEEALNSIAGVKRITSRSFEGRSQSSVEFSLNANMDRAMQDLRDRISAVQSILPKEAKPPTIGRFNLDNDSPTVVFALLSKTRSVQELSLLAELDVTRRIQRVEGVANIGVSGLSSREVRVDLDLDRLRAYGITPAEIGNALREANTDQPVGLLSNKQDDNIVRLEGRPRKASDFTNVVVARRNGLVITVADLAKLDEREREPDTLARMNQQQSISFQVIKQQDANIVAVGDGVKAALDELRKTLPNDVELKTVFASSDWVKESLTGLKRTLIEGALLTVLVVFLFLKSWRSTVITGLTLPIAVIASFIAVHAFGFTLNFMTMMALSLCIGLLIDDAIVVRENIVRHVHMGKDHVTAAREGTEEIGLAVMATTFAICAVFVPIAFMSGIVGKFFFPFGITIATAVLVSLFVSFTLDPMLSSIWPDPAPKRPIESWPIIGHAVRATDRLMHFIETGYTRLVQWIFSGRRWRIPFLPAYGRPFAQNGARLHLQPRQWRRATFTPKAIVLWLALLSLLVALVLSTFLGSEIVPRTDNGFTQISLRMPVGSSLERTNEKVLQIEKAIADISEIETVTASVGGSGSGLSVARNSGSLSISLVDISKRRRSLIEIEDAIRLRIAKIAGVEASVGSNRPIYVALLGNDPEQLSKATTAFAEQASKIKGIVDIESSVKPGLPAWAIRLNPAATRELGISNAQLAANLRTYIAGDTATFYTTADGEQIEVNLRIAQNQRERIEQMRQLPIGFGRDGSPIPLDRVASIVPIENPEVIRRQNLQRREAIFAGVEGRSPGEVGADIEKLTKSFVLPPGVVFDVGGATKEQAEIFSALLSALGLAVIFIYLVLASQFGSLLQPIAIMASLPLALIGVMLALFASGSTLNLFSMIGLVLLMGLVTKNAILLVDFANQARRAGKTVKEALIEAGQVRMRPIIMTTAAMVFGMLPLALALHAGSELQAPMGRAIVGGVIASTLLTLVVVPILYSYLVKDPVSSRNEEFIAPTSPRPDPR
jgi:multidrug efflux pump subunit AcrB